MTNGDWIRSMTDEELAEFLEKSLDQDRDDWETIGCYNCVYYGTHHRDNGDCRDCEFELGILGWLKRK